MLQPDDFYDLVSGRKRGPRAAAMRLMLYAAQWPYAVAVAGRNWRYDHRPGAVTRVPVPVVSVGNLTVGGTGKTPLVKWLARQLRGRDLRVAILSRGYGATEGAKNDEALELEQALADVPHLQSPDRVAIAQAAIDELESQVLLLDDGFQHRRLGRDLDIVLLDATEPFGFEHLLPRGTLREPVTGLQRADVVCLSRADLVDDERRATIRRRVEHLAPEAAWCEVAHVPSRLLRSDGRTQPLAGLAGARVLGFCGIGNPGAFRETLRRSGAEVVAWQAFADHHAYEAADLDRLGELARQSGADWLVATHKDLVKLRTAEIDGRPLWAVEVDLAFLDGEAALLAAIDRVVGHPAGQPT